MLKLANRCKPNLQYLTLPSLAKVREQSQLRYGNSYHLMEALSIFQCKLNVLSYMKWDMYFNTSKEECLLSQDMYTG